MLKSSTLTRKVHLFSLLLALVLCSMIPAGQSIEPEPYRFDIEEGDEIRLETECYFGQRQFESPDLQYRFDIGEGERIELNCGWAPWLYRPNPTLWDELSWPAELAVGGVDPEIR